MHKAIIFLGTSLLFISAIRAADVEMDSDLMRTIEDTNKSLASNIALKNEQGSTADAKELEKMFVDVEAFFVNKGNADDAVQLSKKIRELSADIEKSVAAKDFEAATNSATTLSRTCKTCHNFYKKS